MSYGGRITGPNGYSNGYRSQPNRYDDNYQDSSTSQSSRSRRPRGYGGFTDDESDRSRASSTRPTAQGQGSPYPPSSNGAGANPYANARPDQYSDPYSDPYNSAPPPNASPRRPRDRDPYESRDAPSSMRNYSSRDRLRAPGGGDSGISSNARSNNNFRGVDRSMSYGDGPAAQRIEGVMNHINDNWSVLTKEDCVPTQVAMQLMDTSSLGRGTDYDDFVATGKNLQNSLRAVVNEHHQGFNSSIGTFHKIQSSIQVSQEKIRGLKGSLIDAKSNLTAARPELGDLASASSKYDDMLQIVEKIEKIQTIPEQLDARISEKRFITAVDVLQDGLRLVRHSSLDNINALSDMRVYFSNQETSLTDILLEELHDHLYLKSPYCQSRWKAYNPSPIDTLDTGQGIAGLGMGIRPLYRFLTNLDASDPMTDDSSHNLEEDSFEYIHMIIEALNKIGALDLAVDRMEQRLPIELFAVVEKTNQEVDTRYPAHLRTSGERDWSRPNRKSTKAESVEAVLTDLLHTLYSKFEAIAEGHRAVHEVIEGIIKREGLKKSSHLTKGFKELWKLYQSEMRSLLHDYLATDADALYDARNAANGNNIFRRNQRDRAKKVFKLDGSDEKSAQSLTNQEDLEKILHSSVPGLVSKSNRRNTLPSSNKNSILYDSTAAGHKLLVNPSVFNISVLLPPSLVFLQRLKDTVPPESDIAISTLTSFLDDFLVNVFNPQLDETLTELCSQCFTHVEAFQQDPHWSEHANMPVFKGTSMFYSIVKEFCKMLDNIPQDQMFTTIIMTQLNTYFDRCMTWTETLVSRAEEDGKVEFKPAAAIFKAGGDYLAALKEIWATEGEAREAAMAKEVDFLIERGAGTAVGEFDFMSEKRTATSLCLLFSSMQWLASQLRQLRYVKKDSSTDPKQTRGNNRWTMLSAATGRDGDQPVILPLSEETVGPFDKVLSAYRDLATRALQFLHIDIRLDVMHKMSLLLDSHFSLDQPVSKPDSSTLKLNDDLLSFDDTISAHLPEREYDFMTLGLARLMDSYLITNAGRIKSMNQHGCDSMQLNILVLQQNLRSVEKEAMLSRSAAFFEYFKQGPKVVLQRAEETGGKGLGFTLEELKAVVELYYSEALNSPQREIASQAKRTMGEINLQLTEYMWSV